MKVSSVGVIVESDNYGFLRNKDLRFVYEESVPQMRLMSGDQVIGRVMAPDVAVIQYLLAHTIIAITVLLIKPPIVQIAISYNE